MSAKRSRMKRKGTADGMLTGSKEKLTKRLAGLQSTLDLINSGHGGLDKAGRVVDRRQVPAATPMRRNATEW